MVELVLRMPLRLVESVSDALVDELEALSVSVEDADAGTDLEHAKFGEPGLPVPTVAWDRSTVCALFETDALAEAAATLLLAQDWTRGIHIQSLAEVVEQDWVRLTQSQFKPVSISPGFWVVPSWHDCPADASHVIRLDPGLAFGTGTHPTTRMCLRWIASHAQAWPRVLDYGCGSGILAIAACMHGAEAVDAVDIDPDAVESTRTNAASNGVSPRAGLPSEARGHYSLVLANILASPLKLLAPLLAGHVVSNGSLVLSGILARQAADLTTAYAPWLALRVVDEEDGWVLMSGQRIT